VASHRTLGVTVADRRGTGAGWALQLAATIRRPDGRPVRGASLTIPGIAASCRSTCTLPQTLVRYPVALGAAPVRVFGARRGTGMGVIRVVADVALAVSRSSPPGPYVLTQAWSRVAGP
jgi:hypothetical protein